MAKMRCFSTVLVQLIAVSYLMATPETSQATKGKDSAQIFLPAHWSIFDDARFAINHLGQISVQIIPVDVLKARKTFAHCVGNDLNPLSKQLDYCVGMMPASRHTEWAILPSRAKTGMRSDALLLTALTEPMSSSHTIGASSHNVPFVVDRLSKTLHQGAHQPAIALERGGASFSLASGSAYQMFPLVHQDVHLILPAGWKGEQVSQELVLTHKGVNQLQVYARSLRGVSGEAAEQFSRQPLTVGEEKLSYKGATEIQVGRRLIEVKEHIGMTGKIPVTAWTTVVPYEHGTVYVHMSGPIQRLESSKYLVRLFSDERILSVALPGGAISTPKPVHSNLEMGAQETATRKEVWTSAGDMANLEKQKQNRRRYRHRQDAEASLIPELSDLIFCSNGTLLWRSSSLRRLNRHGTRNLRQHRHSMRQGRWDLINQAGQFFLHIRFGAHQQFVVPIPGATKNGVLAGEMLGSFVQLENDAQCELQ